MSDEIPASDAPYTAHASAYGKDEWGPPNTYPAEKYGCGKGETAETHPAQVDVGDGHRLWVQEYGNPNGEPVIYLHGGPAAAASRPTPASSIQALTRHHPVRPARLRQQHADARRELQGGHLP
ncbi:MAG: hypothetical protein WDN72_04875 [Alphaproteobacteria bacterium]